MRDMKCINTTLEIFNMVLWTLILIKLSKEK